MERTAFFRINLPYGIEKCADQSWICFNREYLPLGLSKVPVLFHSEIREQIESLFIHMKFKNLTDEAIIKAFQKDYITFNSVGKICKVYFYIDATNPSEYPEQWDRYNTCISFFSKFEIEEG